MKIKRRDFMKILGLIGISTVSGAPKAQAWESKAPKDPYGCLVDITRCIGCRSCEIACNKANKLPPPAHSFEDEIVFAKYRRPSDKAYTVVNRFFTGKNDGRHQPLPSFVKIQCMHCQDPGCVSACIAGGITKKKNGAVHYDPDRCIGCRYCMIACPFEMPAYEFDNSLTPQLQKCTFCFDRISRTGGVPACAQMCPREAITFGKRATLLKVAKARIKKKPQLYINHIYGEHEVGGTSWMYISDVPFNDKIGFQTLPRKPIPQLSETIQHGLFSYLWSPIALFGVLGGIMKFVEKRKAKNDKENENDPS